MQLWNDYYPHIFKSYLLNNDTIIIVKTNIKIYIDEQI
jgi:hypothetical protein